MAFHDFILKTVFFQCKSSMSLHKRCKIALCSLSSGIIQRENKGTPRVGTLGKGIWQLRCLGIACYFEEAVA